MPESYDHNLFHKKVDNLLSTPLWIKVVFSCFKQPPWNFTLVLVPLWMISKAILLSDVAGGLIFFSKKPIDIHTLIKILKY